MAERGCVWTDDEIHCILAIWSEDGIERKLNGCHRKDCVWQKIAQETKRHAPTSQSPQSEHVPQIAPDLDIKNMCDLFSLLAEWTESRCWTEYHHEWSSGAAFVYQCVYNGVCTAHWLQYTMHKCFYNKIRCGYGTLLYTHLNKGNICPKLHRPSG